jgi:hypothetical protein
MIVLLIIGILILIIWTNNSSSTNSTQYSTNTTTKTVTNTPPDYPISKSQVSTPSHTISVSPTKISSSPDLKISLIDGEHRYFENHYVNGKQYSFGFPKENCIDKRVWVGIGKIEIERISRSEAMRRIESKKYISNQTKNISSSSSASKKQSVGYCANCNKKLRGNIHKKHCTECYYNGYR